MIVHRTRFLILLLICSAQDLAVAQFDADATLDVTDGSIWSAILLHCTNNALYADLSMQSWERETVPPLDAVYRFSPEEVDSVFCHGTEHSTLPSIIGGIFGAFLGMLPGVLVGGGLGVLVATDDGGTAWGLGLAGGLGGMITGAIIGSSRDASEELPQLICYPTNGMFPAALYSRCLYKNKLPRFLQGATAYTER
jgi:hypothetical protein